MLQRGIQVAEAFASLFTKPRKIEVHTSIRRSKTQMFRGMTGKQGSRTRAVEEVLSKAQPMSRVLFLGIGIDAVFTDPTLLSIIPKRWPLLHRSIGFVVDETFPDLQQLEKAGTAYWEMVTPVSSLINGAGVIAEHILAIWDTVATWKDEMEENGTANGTPTLSYTRRRNNFLNEVEPQQRESRYQTKSRAGLHPSRKRQLAWRKEDKRKNSRSGDDAPGEIPDECEDIPNRFGRSIKIDVQFKYNGQSFRKFYELYRDLLNFEMPR